MKKLNKLQINSEKLMKNEELLTLRGGYDGPCGSDQSWNCTVTACKDCSTYSGTACGSEAYLNSYAKQQAQNYPGWSMNCTTWVNTPIGY